MESAVKMPGSWMVNKASLGLGWLGQGGHGEQDRSHWHSCTGNMAGLNLPSPKGHSRAYGAQRRSSNREQLLQEGSTAQR